MSPQNDRFIEISREELYEEVWAEPILKLAIKYNLSDKGLAKRCAKHKIPRPYAGYWRKLETGHKVRRPKLPKIDNSHLEIISFDLGVEPDKQVLTDIDDDDPRLIIARDFQLPQKFSRYHSHLKPFRDSSVKSTDRYGHIFHKSLLDIKVSANSHKRTYRFLQGLFDLCKLLGWEVGSIPAGQYREGEACIMVEGEELQFKIKEKIKQIDHQPTKEKEWYAPRYDYIPMGTLTLSLTNVGGQPGVISAWRDSASNKLDECWEKIVKDLIACAEVHRCNRIKHEEETRIRKENEIHEQEQWNQQSIQEERVKLLVETAHSHHQSTTVRSFIEEIESQYSASKPQELLEWLEWAKVAADSIEPVKRVDSLLEKHAEVKPVSRYRW